MFDFKGLIDALMRRAREEEDAGPSATRLMVDLPRDEVMVVLTEIIKALAALNRNARIGLKERYRAVQAFDDKARPLAALLVRVFRDEEHIPNLHPRQVLPSLLACWKELASAYKLCLKQHAQAPSARFGRDAELITLRALNYYAEQAKWAYLRHFEVEPRIWRSLNRLYQIAEAAGFARRAIVPYPDQLACTVEEVFLRAALLGVSEPERRRAEDIWLIDAWLPSWFDWVPIEKIVRPREQTYAINLDEPKPPLKMRRNMVGERYRYLNTEPLADYLHELSQASQQGSTIAGQALIPAEQRPLITALLADLSIVYSRAGQARSRRSERRKQEKLAGAVLGLTRITQMLRLNGAGTEWESWTLADESANGLGAHYKARFDDRVAIGEVLAVKEDDGVWLAVVRRLNKSREGQVKVGAERLAPQPTPVMLENDGTSIPALYCAHSPHGRLLLIAREHHHTGAEFNLAAGSKRFRIQLGHPFELLPEYALSGFSVVGKS